MSDDRAPRDSDEALLERLADALTEEGDLVPTDEAEVLRAEQAGVEDVELPPGLAAPPRPPIPIRRFVTHGLAAMVGAAAAAAIAWGLGGEPVELPLGGDPSRTATPVPTAPIEITLPACDDCCAGAACDTATGQLTSCPSGRSCVACALPPLDSLYRLRVGNVMPSELGAEVLSKYPEGKPEICVKAGTSGEVCVSTLISEREGDWMALPIALSRDDLATRLSLRLQWKGVKGPLGTAGRWISPVSITPSSLCRGFVVTFQNDKGEPFGTTSLFLDDAHHVEIARAESVKALAEVAAPLTIRGGQAVVHQTGGGFILTLGPFDRTVAEMVRWQLLERDLPATITTGDDHLGAPMPLR